MNSRRNLFLAILLVVAGGILLPAAFLIRSDRKPMDSPMVAKSLPAKVVGTVPAAGVEAPKLAPAAVKDTPPEPVTSETLAANAAQRARRQEIAQQMLDNVDVLYDRELVNAASDEERAGIEQARQEARALDEKRIANLAKPAEDIGGIALDLAGAGVGLSRAGQTYTLKTGEKFTITIMNQASRGTEIMLSETMPSGHGTLNQRATPTPGQPMQMFLNDGASVQFTPTGTVSPPRPVDETPMPGEKTVIFSSKN